LGQRAAFCRLKSGGQRHGMLQPKRADPGSHQARGMGGASQSCADVPAEAADVGSGGTRNLEPGDRKVPFLKREQSEPMNGNGSGERLDRLAPEGKLIEPAAVEMEGGNERGNLLYLALKAPQNRLEVGGGQGRLGLTEGHLALGVEGGGADAEGGPNFIALFELMNLIREAGCGAQADGKNAGGGRVEGAAMADLQAEGPTNPRHNLLGCHAGWFVEVEKAMQVREGIAGFHQLSSG